MFVRTYFLQSTCFFGRDNPTMMVCMMLNVGGALYTHNIIYCTGKSQQTRRHHTKKGHAKQKMVRLSTALILCVWSLSPLVANAWIPSSIHRLSPSPSSPSPSSLGKYCHRRQVVHKAIKSSDDDETSSSSSTTITTLPQLTLYNSKSRSKEPFQPIQGNTVSMYTCGPTVYDYAHVGNFRAFLTYDLIKRVLLYFGYDVTHICNLTDVDDKIINRANEQGIAVITDLTLKYEGLFFDDLNALNIKLADEYPRATEHITEMMDMILQLAEKDLAYETADGSWYFATDKQKGYGEQLVQLNVEEMESTERGESEGKRHVQDFCLWKAFKPHVDREDAAWESPETHKIQKGRPGWHLECSAMARKYLGDTIDLHGGGIDLKFPHHENEIAQSEGVSGATFCNCWLHNGFVNINDEKMSKSLGNFLTLRTACPQPIMVRSYRYLVMSSQYRNPLSFTPKAMDGAKNALTRIDKVRQQMKQVIEEHENNATSMNDSELATKAVPAALKNFDAALLDDLSMPRATASFFGLVKLAETELKRVAKEGDDANGFDVTGLKAIDKAMDQMDQVFGIFYQVPLAEGEETETNNDGDSGIPEEVLELVVKRSEAKEAKEWELADSLRSRIAEFGFQVKDVKGGDPIVSRVE